MRILSAHQPVYLPGLILFHKIALSDVFVLLPDVQFQRHSWQQRNRVRNGKDAIFLSPHKYIGGPGTPGILVAARALLEKNPNPSETEIRYWLAGNLCRCTGYDKIIRAVQNAAAEMRGESNAA